MFLFQLWTFLRIEVFVQIEKKSVLKTQYEID